MNTDFLKQHLRQLTEHWLARGEVFADRALAPLEVRFDLTGAAAGQYRDGPRPVVRYNLPLALRQPEAFCARTPPHEVAHHVVTQLHVERRVRPHGPEWQAVMAFFGVNASRCHDYDLSGLPRRRQRRFDYRCGCRTHSLSATRHHRVLRAQAIYRCRHCGRPLEPA